MANYQRNTTGVNALKIVAGVAVSLVLLYLAFFFFVGKAVVGTVTG